MALPKNDGQFSEWLNRYNAYVNGNFARLGLTADQTNSLDLLHIQWDTDYEAHTNAHAAAKTATRTKLTTRKAINDMLKAYNKIIQACPTTTDADRQALELTVPGVTTSGTMPFDDKPVPDIDINERYVHEFKVYTRTDVGMIGRKPAGAVGCEIYRNIGPSALPPEEMELVGMKLTTSFLIQYPAEDAGQIVHYAMRWIRKDGTPGAWSETESVIIAA